MNQQTKTVRLSSDEEALCLILARIIARLTQSTEASQ
jgi:hypothetical protein